jgi:hypothetical protein
MKPGFTVKPQSYLPFNPSELIVMNGIQDEFKMTVVFQFEHCYIRRNENRTHTLFNQILGHEGN